MQAMSLYEPGPIVSGRLRPTELEIPLPGADQIVLKTSICGVCRTDLHTVEGDLDLPRLPIIPGHQVVGTVFAKGGLVEEFNLGDRAGVAWLYKTCGNCVYCRHGMENLCESAMFTGLHANGGYAQYMVVGADYAYPLPDRFEDANAAPLLCAGIVGYRSLKLSGIQPGGSLGLYGFGASAHLVIQVAVSWDCRVHVFSRGKEHRRLAQELGAIWTGEAEEEPPEPLDGSVIFAPAGWIVPLALKHLRPGGILAINAIHMSDIPQMPYQTIYGERVLRSVANFTRSDASEFLGLAAEIPIESTVELFPLEEANEVLVKMKRSELQASAALLIG